MNNNDGYYSFDQNAVPHASVAREEDFTAMNAFQADNSVVFEQNSSFTADTAGNSYAFEESTLPQPAVNTVSYPMSTYQEMVESQYSFNQFALPQLAVTNAFDFDFNTSNLNVLPGYPPANTSIDQQAFEQTLTELNGPDWSSAAGPNALSGDTTFGRQTTGSDLNAPFELDESE